MKIRSEKPGLFKLKVAVLFIKTPTESQEGLVQKLSSVKIIPPPPPPSPPRPSSKSSCA
ncbi:MAG: hypothetical protein IPK14_17940 [Blastocatellia bacterium]|nr:hypothetical protein [Blastocatellia bacterium]